MSKKDGHPHTRHDAFSKQAFEAMLGPFGDVNTQHLVDADPQYADVWFVPSTQGPRPESLGLVASMVRERCILEVYRKTPNTDDIRAEVEKSLTLSRTMSASRGRPIRLRAWILSPGLPKRALEEMGFRPDIDLSPRGVYQMPIGLCVGLVVINELPVTDETLMLRVFGRAKHQELALKQLHARKDEDGTPNKLWALVMRWRIRVQNKPEDRRTELDDEFIDNVAWLKEYERKTKEEAIAEGMAEGRAEGKVEGKVEGRAEVAEQLTDLVVQDRLGRTMTAGERLGLRHLLQTNDARALVRRVLSSEQKELSNWLLASAPQDQI